MTSDLFPVVILAGGLATRMRPLTETMPKALVPVNGKAFVDHQLQLLKQQGLYDIVFCVGYLGEQLECYVGDGSRYGLQIKFIYDGPELLGTAGAIKKALSAVSDNFFVLNGDSYLPCNYRAVQQTFLHQQKLALMTVFRNDNQWDRSNVEYYDQQIIQYNKNYRTERMSHIDYGLALFNQAAFLDVPMATYCDLTMVYQKLIAEHQLAVHEVTERFYENGSFSGVHDFEQYLQQLSLVNS